MRQVGLRRLLAGLALLTAPVALIGGVAPAQAASGAVTIAGFGMTGCTATYCYQPSSLTVAPGTQVTWTNTSSANHTVTRCTPSMCNNNGGGTGSDSGLDASVPSGGHASFTFNGPGTYVYYCTIHGYSVMNGQVTVSGTPPTPTAPPHTPAPTPLPTPIQPTAPPTATHTAAPTPAPTATPSATATPAPTPTNTAVALATPQSTPSATVGAIAAQPPSTDTGGGGSKTGLIIAVVLIVAGITSGAFVLRGRVGRKPTP